MGGGDIDRTPIRPNAPPSATGVFLDVSLIFRLPPPTDRLYRTILYYKLMRYVIYRYTILRCSILRYIAIVLY